MIKAEEVAEIAMHHGDCLEVMSQLQDNSVDMILCREHAII